MGVMDLARHLRTWQPAELARLLRLVITNATRPDGDV